MARKKNTYSLEFKKQLIAEIESNVVSLNEQARKHGISPGLLTIWRKKFREGTLTASPDRRVRELEKENESLKTTIGSLYRQVEALKKMELDSQRRKKESSLIISGRNLVQSKKPAKR
jgi:transposase-like protein